MMPNVATPQPPLVKLASEAVASETSFLNPVCAEPTARTRALNVTAEVQDEPVAKMFSAPAVISTRKNASPPKPTKP